MCCHELLLDGGGEGEMVEDFTGQVWECMMHEQMSVSLEHNF